MTNRDAMEFDLKTEFLGGGEWSAEVFRDAEDSGVEPAKYVHETKAVKSGDVLPLRMAPGGGFVVRFSRR